jgi:ureidoacrylate peracid hydrolase
LTNEENTLMATIQLRARHYKYYPPEHHIGPTEEWLDLEVAETAFLIVDVYGLGYDPGSDLADVPELYRRQIVSNRDIVVNHIRPSRDRAHELGLPVVYAQNHLSPALTARTEFRLMSLRTVDVDCLDVWQEPNQILAFSDIIAPESGDYVIPKQQASGFFETPLDSLLRSLGVKNLIVVGFDARLCLGMTVMDALYRNYRVIVLRDCTDTMEYPETVDNRWCYFVAIRQIETNVGYTATSSDWIAARGVTEIGSV